MHENQLVNDCLRRHGGALLFMAPEWSETERVVHCQIVDVFALQGVDCIAAGRNCWRPPNRQH